MNGMKGFIIFQFVAVIGATVGVFTNTPRLILYSIFMMLWQIAWYLAEWGED